VKKFGVSPIIEGNVNETVDGWLISGRQPFEHTAETFLV
jgi:hypothetical protein